MPEATESAPESPLARAAHDLAATVERRTGAPVVPSTVTEAEIGRMARELDLPAVYIEFLRAHASLSFSDLPLRPGHEGWLSSGAAFESTHLGYADAADWPADWIVIGTDYRGCYVLDLATLADGDAAVSYVKDDADLRAEPVAPSFVAFLGQITAGLDARAGDPRDARKQLVPAVQALAATVQSRRGGDGRSIAADPDALARLREEYRLPVVYAEFLRAHSSEAFSIDAGLSCEGVACALSTVDGFEAAHAAYAGYSGWRRAWIVIALDYEACYVLDLATEQDGDCEVLRLDHGGGNRPVEVADSFVALLWRVAEDSREPRGIPAPPAGPHAPTRKDPFRVLDTVLAVAFILLVIALSTALVLGFFALVGWLVRSCIG